MKTRTVTQGEAKLTFSKEASYNLFNQNIFIVFANIKAEGIVKYLTIKETCEKTRTFTLNFAVEGGCELFGYQFKKGYDKTFTNDEVEACPTNAITHDDYVLEILF